MKRKQKVLLIGASVVAVVLSVIGGTVAAYSWTHTGQVWIERGLAIGTNVHEPPDYHILLKDNKHFLKAQTGSLSLANYQGAPKRAEYAAQDDGSAGMYSFQDNTFGPRGAVVAQSDGCVQMTAAYSGAQVFASTSGDVVITLGQ